MSENTKEPAAFLKVVRPKKKLAASQTPAVTKPAPDETGSTAAPSPGSEETRTTAAPRSSAEDTGTTAALSSAPEEKGTADATTSAGETGTADATTPPPGASETGPATTAAAEKKGTPSSLQVVRSKKKRPSSQDSQDKDATSPAPSAPGPQPAEATPSPSSTSPASEETATTEPQAANAAPAPAISIAALPSVPLVLSDELEEFRRWIGEWADKYVAPNAAKYDELEETPWALIKQARKDGPFSPELFFDVAVMDKTGLKMVILVEEVCRRDLGLFLGIFGSLLAIAGIQANGTIEQQLKWIPVCFGTEENPGVAALAATEPGAGSDSSAQITRAVFDKDTNEWVLNGQKTFITNGGLPGAVHVVTARASHPDYGDLGVLSFVVPPGTTGLSQGSKFKKLGIRASHTAEVNLDDVRVPADCMLDMLEKHTARAAARREGKRTSGGQAATKTFEKSRHVVGAMGLGAQVACFEIALKYAKTREQFGQRIGDFQKVAAMLVEMKKNIDMSRYFVWRAATMSANNMDFAGAEGSMAKLVATEAANKSAYDALQILGGYGYIRDFDIERIYRDVRILTIFEGTSQIQENIIAKALLQD